MSTVKQQLKLTQLQARPYVRYWPTFNETGPDKLSAKMLTENLSPIPAHVIYNQLKTWVDEQTTTTFLYNRTGDILYQNKRGVSDLPPLPKKLAKDAIGGAVKLMIGTCVVYGSISSSDGRRWEVRGLYSYTPNEALPSDEYLTDAEVGENADHCDTSTIRSEWEQRKGKTRELTPSGSK